MLLMYKEGRKADVTSKRKEVTESRARNRTLAMSFSLM